MPKTDAYAALRPDGTFTTGDGAVAMSSGDDAPQGDGSGVSTTMRRRDGGHIGTYDIEAYTLTLCFADGRTERTSILWDGTAKPGEDPYRVLWIRGASFKITGTQ